MAIDQSKDDNESQRLPEYESQKAYRDGIPIDESIAGGNSSPTTGSFLIETANQKRTSKMTRKDCVPLHLHRFHQGGRVQVLQIQTQCSLRKKGSAIGNQQQPEKRSQARSAAMRDLHCMVIERTVQIVGPRNKYPGGTP